LQQKKPQPLKDLQKLVAQHHSHRRAPTRWKQKKNNHEEKDDVDIPKTCTCCDCRVRQSTCNQPRCETHADALQLQNFFQSDPSRKKCGILGRYKPE
jgi:hypothetical protein